MSKPLTLRAAYGVLDQLNADGAVKKTERRDRLMRVVYDGRALGEHGVRFQNNDPTEGQYVKELAEVVSFAHLAVGTGIDAEIVNIQNARPPEPDLAVSLTGGREIYVEVAQVTESASARAAGSMLAVNKHLHQRYESDPAYAKTLRGRHLDFRFPSVPASRETRAVADEMVAILASTDFATVQRRTFLTPSPLIAPVLHRLGARYYIGAGTSTAMMAQIDAHSFDPYESADDFDERLRDKMTKTYTQDRPIWLALVLNDHMQVPPLSMDAIRARLPSNIGQFERLLFGTLEDAEIIVK